jgi:hypothetical protein
MASNMKAQGFGLPVAALLDLEFHFVWPDSFVAERAAPATALAAPHARGRYVRELSFLNAVTRNTPECRIDLRNHGSCSPGARRLPDSKRRAVLSNA